MRVVWKWQETRKQPLSIRIACSYTVASCTSRVIANFQLAAFLASVARLFAFFWAVSKASRRDGGSARWSRSTGRALALTLELDLLGRVPCVGRGALYILDDIASSLLEVVKRARCLCLCVLLRGGSLERCLVAGLVGLVGCLVAGLVGLDLDILGRLGGLDLCVLRDAARLLRACTDGRLDCLAGLLGGLC